MAQVIPGLMWSALFSGVEWAVVPDLHIHWGWPLAITSSAAAEGVGARRSATKSQMVQSVSWPTAEMTGMVDLTRDAHGHTRARLLDLVPGRSGAAYKDWLTDRGKAFRTRVQVATLDPFHGYKNAIDDQLEDARSAWIHRWGWCCGRGVERECPSEQGGSGLRRLDHPVQEGHLVSETFSHDPACF